MTMTLEESIRHRYIQLCENIRRDRQAAKALAATTKLRTPEHKKQHQAIKERERVEWYKHDELKLVANRAGIDLKGAEHPNRTSQELQTTTEGPLTAEQLDHI